MLHMMPKKQKRNAIMIDAMLHRMPTDQATMQKKMKRKNY
jgi:hypothetical protein